MALACLTHLGHRQVFGRPLVFEAELLLDLPGLLITVIITAPDARKAQILKGMSEHFPGGFRHKAPPPVRNADPVAQLRFIVFFRKVIVMQAFLTQRTVPCVR